MFIHHAIEEDGFELINSLHNYRFYGIDEDCPIPSAELQQVVVPRSSNVLDDAQFTALQDAVDPLADSNNYGIEQVRSLITQIRPGEVYY